MRRRLLALCHHSSLQTAPVFSLHMDTDEHIHIHFYALSTCSRTISNPLCSDHWSGTPTQVGYGPGINISLGLMFSMLNCPPSGFLFGNLALQWRTTPLRYHSSFQTTLLQPRSTFEQCHTEYKLWHVTKQCHALSQVHALTDRKATDRKVIVDTCPPWMSDIKKPAGSIIITLLEQGQKTENYYIKICEIMTLIHKEKYAIFVCFCSKYSLSL